MKVLFVNTLYYPDKVGGAEVSVQLLAEAMVNEGHVVRVMCLKPSGKEVLEVINGVEVHRLCIKNIYWPFHAKDRSFPCRMVWHLLDSFNLLSFFDVLSAVNKFKPDVMHTNNLCGFSVSAWCAAYFKGVGLVHTTRDYYLIHPNCKLYSNGSNQDVNGPGVLFWSYLKKKVSRVVDCYVGISNYIHDLHVSCGFFNSAVTSVVYNSIKDQGLRECEPRRLASVGVKLGFIGRIDSVKGLNVLLDAMALLPDGFELYVAGDGDFKYLEYLKVKYKDLAVNYLGHVPVSEFFRKIDFLVVPSLWNEPLGRVVIESYTFGVPVIVSNTGGLPEIVQQGITGFVYPANESAALRDRIQMLQSIDYCEMSKACLNYAERFNEKDVAAAYLNIYMSLLGRG